MEYIIRIRILFQKEFRLITNIYSQFFLQLKAIIPNVTFNEFAIKKFIQLSKF